MLQRFAVVLVASGLAMTVACAKSDSSITTAVKAKMAADDTVKAYEINVDTYRKVVTLTGNVESAAARDQALLIARQTDGVTEVVDHIAVAAPPEATKGNVEEKLDAAGHAISDTAHDVAGAVKDAAHDTKENVEDAAITSAVKTKFLAEPGVSGLKIDVDTNDGVVTLSGMVKSSAEADKAVSIAQKSTGVKRVVNRLRVG